jgi:hypothetical protein
MDITARIVFGALLSTNESLANITEEMERSLKECGARFEYDGAAAVGEVTVVIAAGPYVTAACPGASPTAFELPSIEKEWHRCVLAAAGSLGLCVGRPGWLLLVSAS